MVCGGAGAGGVSQLRCPLCTTPGGPARRRARASRAGGRARGVRGRSERHGAVGSDAGGGQPGDRGEGAGAAGQGGGRAAAGKGAGAALSSCCVAWGRAAARPRDDALARAPMHAHARPHSHAQVDVIVSEPMGTLLVNERMIESYLFARERWLKPGGRMFPVRGQRAHLCGCVHGGGAAGVQHPPLPRAPSPSPPPPYYTHNTCPPTRAEPGAHPRHRLLRRAAARRGGGARLVLHQPRLLRRGPVLPAAPRLARLLWPGGCCTSWAVGAVQLEGGRCTAARWRARSPRARHTQQLAPSATPPPRVLPGP